MKAQQTLPTLNLDSRADTKLLRLRFSYVAKKLKFAVRPREQADELRDYLVETQQVFADWPIRLPGEEIAGLNFTIDKLAIPAEVLLQADIKNQRIAVRCLNIHRFEDQVDTYTPEQLNQRWLDKLGSHLLAQTHTIDAQPLKGKEREAFQRMVREDQQRREQELAEAEAAELAEKQNRRLSARIGRILGTQTDGT